MPGRGRRGAAGFTTSPDLRFADTMDAVPWGQAENPRKLRNSAARGLTAPGATSLRSPALPRKVRSGTPPQASSPPPRGAAGGWIGSLSAGRPADSLTRPTGSLGGGDLGLRHQLLAVPLRLRRVEGTVAVGGDAAQAVHHAAGAGRDET